MILGFLQQVVKEASLQRLHDNVRLAVLLTDVMDGNDMGVVPEAAHRLRLAPDTGKALGIQAIGLDEGQGNVAIQLRIVGQIHTLLATLPQEAPHLITPGGE